MRQQFLKTHVPTIPFLSLKNVTVMESLMPQGIVTYSFPASVTEVLQEFAERDFAVSDVPEMAGHNFAHNVIGWIVRLQTTPYHVV